MATRAFSYLRFSTPEQAKGDSSRRQAALAADYAARHGLDLDDSLTFHDLGVSAFRGRNAKKGALRKFLEAVEEGIVEAGSYLLVESLDRISRDEILEAQGTFLQIISAGITLVTLIDQRRYSRDGINANPTDLIISLVGMMRANEESATKSRRLKSSWENKRALAETNKLTRQAPAWLVLSEDRRSWSIIPERAEVVRRIFEMSAEGLGEHSIAAGLNRGGISPFGSGKFWRRTSIIRILESPAVAGAMIPHFMEHKEGRKVRKPLVPVRDYFPKIISDELRASVAAVRTEAVNPRRGRHARSEQKNILGGLARCPLCDGTMTRVVKGSGAKSGRPRLVCTRAKVGAGCRYKAVPQHEVEDGLLRNLDALCALDDVPQPGSMVGEIAVHRGRISEAEGRVQRITAAIADGPSSRALRAELAAAENELDNLRIELRELAAVADVTDVRMLSRFADEIRAAARTDDVAALNAALRRLFGRVVPHWPSGYLVAVRKNGSSRAVRIAEPEPIDKVPPQWRDRVAAEAGRSLGREAADGVFVSGGFALERLRPRNSPKF